MRCASIPLSDRGVPDGLGGLRQHRLVQDRDLVPALEDALQIAEQPGADDHRVGRVDQDVDGHGLSHVRPFRVACGQGGRRGWGLGAGRRCQLGRGAAPRRASTASPRVRRVGILEARHDVAHHRAGVAAVGVHPNGGDPPVQRNPLRHQLAVSLGGVAAGQQRSHGAAGGAPDAFGRADLQEDHGVAGQRFAHALRSDRAAAEGHDAVVLGQGGAHHGLLYAAELLLAIHEHVGDAAAGGLDDLGVGVQQRHLHAPWPGGVRSWTYRSPAYPSTPLWGPSARRPCATASAGSRAATARR